MPDNLDWSRFVVRINIRAPRPQLYAAWASRKGMESWFLRTCEYVKKSGDVLGEENFAIVGDSYIFRWCVYRDEVTETGVITEANGHDQFQFGFGKAGICTVRILMAGEEQIVELVQEEIPTDEAGKINYHVGCKTGWTFYLTNLKSLAEGGIDLRNRDVNLQNMLNS